MDDFLPPLLSDLIALIRTTMQLMEAA